MTIDGDEQKFDAYEGKTLLIVNVASKCGFTPQYRGLEALYEKLRDKGLVVLGFPCDQFGHQEPGDEEEIKGFCSLNYDVQVSAVRQDRRQRRNTHPLYKYLKRRGQGRARQRIDQMEFHQVPVGKDGKVVRRYAPTDTPQSIEKDVVAAL